MYLPINADSTKSRTVDFYCNYRLNHGHLRPLPEKGRRLTAVGIITNRIAIVNTLCRVTSIPSTAVF